MKKYDGSKAVIRFGDRVVPIEAFSVERVGIAWIDPSTHTPGDSAPEVTQTPKSGAEIAGRVLAEGFASGMNPRTFDTEGVEVLDVPALPPYEPEGGAS